MYFPRLKKALIGQESAVKLRHYFQAEEVYIPRCEVALRSLRNERLKADFDHITQTEKKSGRTAMLELCPKYKLCDRQAWEIIYASSSPAISTSRVILEQVGVEVSSPIN